MTFENPIWLYIAPLTSILIALLIGLGLRRREDLLSRFAATRLLEQLTEKANTQRILIKGALVALSFCLLCIALARPQFGIEWTERKARGLDIVFVLDASKSMLATDIRPNRLARAKLAILDLVEQLESDRIGLVAFAGRAFLQTPPTLDYAAFRESLESTTTAVMSRGGSDLGNAIREAAKAFPAENNFKVVVLLTDGEDLGGDAIAAVEEARADNVKIYAIGLGTPEGEYLRIQNASGQDEFLRDEAGQPVRSQLDEGTLQQIAQISGGIYNRLGSGGLDQLYSSVISTLPRNERESELEEVRIERYQWLIAAVCILLTADLLIRRRANTQIATTLALCWLSLQPSELKAQSGTLPTTSPNTPAEITEVEPKPIQEPITDARQLYNQGIEAITTLDFEKARDSLEQASILAKNPKLQQDALFNLAHANNQIGEAAYKAQDFETAVQQWQKAEDLFNATASLNPEDSIAQENAATMQARRQALEQFLEQQKQQQDQQQNDDSQQQDGEQSDQQNQDQQQNSEQSQNQEGSENQQDQQQDGNESQQQDGEQQQQQQSQESGDESNQDPQSSQDAENADPNSEQQASSNRNPAEDMENARQQAEQEAAEQAEQSAESDEQGQEETASPEEASTEDVPTTEAQAAAASQDTGELTEEQQMRLEVRQLLDSLRGKEQVLPFIDQSTPSSNKKNQDW